MPATLLSLRYRSCCSVALVAVLWAGNVFGQGSCSESEDLALLDFWLGEWRVVDEAEQLLGHNTIMRILNGCVLEERWQGRNGGMGFSLFYVNPATAALKQVWVSGQAMLPGGVKEKEVIMAEAGVSVVFQGSYPSAQGRVLDRTTLIRQDNGDVLQLIELSMDDGETWQSSFRGLYQARP